MSFNFEETVTSKTNSELSDIYLNRSNYQHEFYKAAVNEMRKRGMELLELKHDRSDKMQTEISVLEQGKAGNAAYIILCAILAVVGGPLGIYGGYIYAYSKVEGPDGRMYHAYDSTTRKYGKLILGITAGWIAYFLLKEILAFSPA